LEPASDLRVLAPIAPGLVADLGVGAVAVLSPDQPVALPRCRGVIALDGERELELRDETVTVALSLAGPWTVDVPRTMAVAAERGLLARASR
jgi:hypothetical protein